MRIPKEILKAKEIAEMAYKNKDNTLIMQANLIINKYNNKNKNQWKYWTYWLYNLLINFNDMETQQSIAIQEAIIQVNKLENSREKSLILTKLQEAGLWLYELENGIH